MLACYKTDKQDEKPFSRIAIKNTENKYILANCLFQKLCSSSWLNCSKDLSKACLKARNCLDTYKWIGILFAFFHGYLKLFKEFITDFSKYITFKKVQIRQN